MMRTLLAIPPRGRLRLPAHRPRRLRGRTVRTRKLNLGSADEPPSAAQQRGAAAASSARSSASPSSSASSTGSTGCSSRSRPPRTTAAAGDGLETLATLPLGTNRSLHLVRAGGEIVLLGAAEHGVTPIRRYSEAEARALGLLEARDADAGARRSRASSPRRSPRASSTSLRSKTVVK